MKKNKVLIVIDMQVDFVTGALGSPEAQSVVPKISEKIDRYVKQGYDVIFTKDTHDENYLETQEGKYLPVKHCVIGTDGWNIVDGLEVDGSLYVEKNTFGYKWWEQKLLRLKPTEIEMVGVCTDICVITNAILIKTARPGTKVIIDASCCAGTTLERHKAALEVMKSCQIEIINEV